MPAARDGGKVCLLLLEESGLDPAAAGLDAAAVGTIA